MNTVVVTSENLEITRETLPCDQARELAVGATIHRWRDEDGVQHVIMSLPGGRVAWATNADSQWAEVGPETGTISLSDGFVVLGHGWCPVLPYTAAHAAVQEHHCGVVCGVHSDEASSDDAADAVADVVAEGVSGVDWNPPRWWVRKARRHAREMASSMWEHREAGDCSAVATAGREHCDGCGWVPAVASPADLELARAYGAGAAKNEFDAIDGRDDVDPADVTPCLEHWYGRKSVLNAIGIDSDDAESTRATEMLAAAEEAATEEWTSLLLAANLERVKEMHWLILEKFGPLISQDRACALQQKMTELGFSIEIREPRDEESEGTFSESLPIGELPIHLRNAFESVLTNVLLETK